MWKLFIVLIIVIAGAIAYPSPIDSKAFQPSRSLAMNGVLAPNDALQVTQLTSLPAGSRGGEDIAVDTLKCVYTGVENGDILRKCPYSDWEVLANTGGRPLGLAFDQEQNLIIADGEKGLLKLTPKQDLTTLVDQYQGQRLGVVDDVDIAADGTIYFSDASALFSLKDHFFDGLNADPSGRLFAYDPANNSLKLLANDLFFANGVAVAKNQQFVLVNETFAYRISRVWIGGEKAGQKDIFLDKLPGFPDGIATDADGSFWLAIFAPRSQLIDKIQPLPWVKNQLAKLPHDLAPVPPAYGLVIQLSPEGKIMHSLHDQAAVAIGEITSVQPEEEGLYLGTLNGPAIGNLAF